MIPLAEADVKSAALARLDRQSWGVAQGPDFAPDPQRVERADDVQVMLERRPRYTSPPSTTAPPAAPSTTPFPKSSTPLNLTTLRHLLATEPTISNHRL